jgi:hypothetical protein
MRRTSKEEEDDEINEEEEEDCAAAAAAAAVAAATPATTAGRYASSAATASNQAVAAARLSGLRRITIAAAADTAECHSGHLFCVCLLSECPLHVAQNSMFHGSFPPDSGQIQGSGGLRNKLILPWND